MKNLIKRKLRERFHVTPKVGTQYSGVLIAEDRFYAVFADVVAYPEGAAPVKVEGEFYQPQANVAYLQRLLNATE